MSTAPTSSPVPAPKVSREDRFSTDKSVVGDVTILTMRGTLNEGFEGKKLAESVKTKKLIMNLKEVRRVASWGMGEWMEFLRVLGDKDVYIVEASTYATSQLNLVTGLLGRSKFVSFYAAYRCRGCSQSSDSVFVVPRDRSIIRELPRSETECTKCGNVVQLEEYPAAFFDTIADREAFDIDDAVLGILRTKFKYDIAQDTTRFRASSYSQGELTYLRLSGNLSAIVPEKVLEATEGTTIVDLEGGVFDGEGIDAWRAYFQGALSKVKTLQLLACPSGFLEHAVETNDLRNGLVVRSFAMLYECRRCDQTSSMFSVDVASNLEELVQGHLPGQSCPSCKSSVVPLLTPALLQRIKALPARDRDPALEKFLLKAKAEPLPKLHNVLGPAQAKAKGAAAAGERGGRGMMFAILAVIVAVLGALTYVVVNMSRDHENERDKRLATDLPVFDAGAVRPKFVRPDWITSDAPSSAYCLDMMNQFSCVGVSSYRVNRDEALKEANDAALEELVYTIGLKITEPYFDTMVGQDYAGQRSKLIVDLRSAEADRTSEAYIGALKALVDGRRRVVQALRMTGGPGVPVEISQCTSTSTCYWEEYETETGKPNEQLVWVHFVVGVDAVRSMVGRYSDLVTVTGNQLVTVFPGVALQPDQAGNGAMVIKLGRGPLAKSGIAVKSVISEVDSKPITDAPQLAHTLDEAAKADRQVILGVTTGSEPLQQLTVRL
jgi:hypothetical protein